MIYIENGPNYYTYTFRINRANAPADAPVENLVLSPLSDGSWKEELVTYNFTTQEKQAILFGGAVDLAGKVTKEMLQSGTYSSGIMNKKLADECYLMTYSYYTSCSQDAHHHGEAADEDGGPCEADTQSVLVVTQALICPNPGGSTTDPGGNESGTTPGGFNPSGGGATTNPTDPPGSGAINPENPCDENGIPSQPQDPSSTLGNQPCNNGTVTLPNLLSTHDPCWIIKKNFANAKFKDKVAAIDKPEVFDYDHEMGYAAGYPPANTGVIGTQYPPMENTLGSHNVTLPTGNQYFGFIHSHTNREGAVKMFSPADLATFLTSCVVNADTNGNIGDAYAMVITSQGNYILKYTGFSTTFGIGPNGTNFWNAWYERELLEIQNEDKSFDQNKIEKVFLRFLKEKVKIDGVQLYKVDKITGKANELTLGSNNNVIPTPCD
ncbi:hypothetical protein [Chryseobacterium wangxinyae]|uniref:hypothetical protein n=1 Tax=Chryseobacterium sp. CY353 TaxID=2997334 RepID=UPI00226D7431|nr:hypothetical protein [Chryseobacterium sp. CY353]MCY0969530.1 hypothetical protein [Chryseobacterium sp. CY353]